MISIYEPNTDYRHDRKSYLIQWDIKRAYYISQIKDVKHSPNIIDLIEVGDIISLNHMERVFKVIKTDKNRIYGANETLSKSTMLQDYKVEVVTKENFKSVSYEV